MGGFKGLILLMSPSRKSDESREKSADSGHTVDTQRTHTHVADPTEMDSEICSEIQGGEHAQYLDLPWRKLL